MQIKGKTNMKFLRIASLPIAMLVFATTAQSTVITGEALKRTSFVNNADGPDGYWILENAWNDNQGDNAGDTITYQAHLNDDAPTWSLAKGACKDLTRETAITSIHGFSPSTARLIGFDTARMSFDFSKAAVKKIAKDAEFKLFVQIDIRVRGDKRYYRLQSEGYNPAMLGKGKVYPQQWIWHNGQDLLGNLTQNGGVKLGDIESIDYSFVMRKFTPNTNGTGTAFFTVKDPTLIYRVEVPETQETLGLIAY